MEIKRSFVYYLSGTGTTEKYANALASQLPGDVTIQPLDARVYLEEKLDSSDLVVVAAPVFGGFITPFVWSQLAYVKGNGTPAVAVAVYGARDYDSALLEMKEELSKMGCTLVGAADVVARHSIVQTVAADRPDSADIEGMEAFGKQISERLAGMASIDDAPAFEFKGEVPENIEPTGIVPIVTDDCTFCGTCVEPCPAMAIPDSEPNTTNNEICISCLKCIEVCPFHARILPPPMVEAVSGMLANLADPAKENEYF